MLIFTLGPPGSGKTTASKLLAEQLTLQYVGAGDVARKLAETDEETRDLLARGQMAARGKMNLAMSEVIRRPGKVVDGYPRYMEQLADLYRVVSVRPIFIAFGASNHVLINRLEGRGRSDDTFANINNRLSNYFAETEPVIDYLAHRGERVLTLNTEHRSPDSCARAAATFISKFLA